MQLLSYSDICQVSGGAQPTKEEVLSAMEHYSFFGALLGGAASGIYGLCTNHTVTTIVGRTLTMTGSFVDVFFMGLGISWMAGAAVGLGVVAYNAS